MIISMNMAAAETRGLTNQTPEAIGTRRLARRPAINVGNVSGGAHRLVKTSERVAHDIVRDVVDRQLRTGDQLPLEAAMVEEYQASRTSVREALRLLEVQGLIRLKPGPGGGPVVGSVDPANLARTAALYFRLGAATYDDLLRTQAMLEPLCAFYAARHPDRSTAMRPYLTPGDARDHAYRRHAEGFHDAVYRLAGNQVLTLLTQAVTHIVTDHVVSTMDPVDMRQKILHEHARLARAIAGGQADVAARLMADHFQAQHGFYRQHWPARLAELVEWR
jgi:GntR family transcriptional regulator, transcriptional repressor for pyruvate dehydrogenase complex